MVLMTQIDLMILLHSKVQTTQIDLMTLLQSKLQTTKIKLMTLLQPKVQTAQELQSKGSLLSLLQPSKNPSKSRKFSRQIPKSRTLRARMTTLNPQNDVNFKSLIIYLIYKIMVSKSLFLKNFELDEKRGRSHAASFLESILP